MSILKLFADAEYKCHLHSSMLCEWNKLRTRKNLDLPVSLSQRKTRNICSMVRSGIIVPIAELVVIGNTCTRLKIIRYELVKMEKMKAKSKTVLKIKQHCMQNLEPILFPASNDNYAIS
jgi:hypothetical protein